MKMLTSGPTAPVIFKASSPAWRYRTRRVKEGPQVSRHACIRATVGSKRSGMAKRSDEIRIAHDMTS